MRTCPPGRPGPILLTRMLTTDLDKPGCGLGDQIIVDRRRELANLMAGGPFWTRRILLRIRCSPEVSAPWRVSVGQQRRGSPQSPLPTRHMSGTAKLSVTRFVHGFVHKTRRDGLRRGRRSGPDTTVRRPSPEVSAATRDDARQQRQTSYGS